MQDLLEIQNITKAFGGVKAIDNCSFQVRKNTITGLIGPNGAGKTTMFNTISGLIAPDEGNIYFNDQNITQIASHKRAKLGIARSYQAIRLFPELTALENIVIAFEENKEKLWHAFTNHKPNQEKLKKRALKLLEEVNLEEKNNLKGYELSYGQKKLIEILRTKANDSQLILLDEPTAGINPTLIKKVTKIIRQFKEDGRTVLIVEHNMPFIMDLCETIVVMDQGKHLITGKPKEVQTNPEVLQAYLGKQKVKND